MTVLITSNKKTKRNPKVYHFVSVTLIYFCFTKLIFSFVAGKPGIPMLQNSETAVISEQLTLTWSAAAENGGKILTYTVWWREVQSNGGVCDWRTQNTSSDGLTYTLTGLKVGMTYDFGITAWNKYGESALDEANNLKRIKVIPSM